MSTLEESLAFPGGEQAVTAVSSTRWTRFEVWLARLSDRLNPILIKEARQALRSRQFTSTFFLMLAAGWTWSIMGVALLGPAAYYSAEGTSMFFGYYVVLAAPLIVVAPYFAFNSLSAERQDRTYELVSITTLSAGQILFGKLCGVSMQMIVYLSALFPCLAFTYLLRGLDIFTVFLVVVYTCLVSLGLSMLGLLLATLAPSRQRQIIQGVMLAVFLCYCYAMMIGVVSTVVGSEGVLFGNSGFWLANLAMATLYANAFAIVFLSARTQLTTASQNRSTPLRIALIVAHLSMIAWITWGVLLGDRYITYAYLIFCSLFWSAAGVFLTGESKLLSERVKRDLPQSGLGRLFLTWLAPGPGTGYMFVLANMLTMTLVGTSLATPEFRERFAPATAITRGTAWQVSPLDFLQTGLVATCYLAIYLGIGKLILTAVRRFDEVRLSMRVLVYVLLLMVGAGAPWVLQISNPQTRNLGYTGLQITNPFWTLSEYCSRGVPANGFLLLSMLLLAAIAVWVMNLPSLIAEVKQVRIAKPPRVIDEDQELAAAAAPAPARSSPWDE